MLLIDKHLFITGEGPVKSAFYLVVWFCYTAGKEFVSVSRNVLKCTLPIAHSNSTSKKQFILRKSEIKNKIPALRYLSPTLGIKIMFTMDF